MFGCTRLQHDRLKLITTAIGRLVVGGGEVIGRDEGGYHAFSLSPGHGKHIRSDGSFVRVGAQSRKGGLEIDSRI